MITIRFLTPVFHKIILEVIYSCLNLFYLKNTFYNYK